jgi:hypothetical protein
MHSVLEGIDRLVGPGNFLARCATLLMQHAPLATELHAQPQRRRTAGQTELVTLKFTEEDKW